MQIISVINQKGGVGKTTTVINLAAGLSQLNKKILVIDLDPQGNATTGLGLSNMDSSSDTIYGVLNGMKEISEVIKKTKFKNLDIGSICIVLLGSTFGLILRIFIQNNFKVKIGFDIQNTSIVNFIASFFLGILVAFNFVNNNILLLFYTGFLGCFSTFSSFIFQLFILIKKRKFIRLFFHYFEVIILSFICFYLGFYLIQIIK